ncbi:MAG: PEP-CTERM sorting domain-containing protein [Planctomycetota bacterium]
MKKVLAFGVVALLATTMAQADFTISGLTADSAGPVGDAANTIIPYAFGGPDFTQPWKMTVEGDLTEVLTGTWANEARFRVTAPNASAWNSASWIATGDYTGTIHVGPSTQTTTLTGSAVGNWSFEAYESYNDGAGVDQQWTDLSITIFTPPPPEPPVAQNLGDIAGGAVETGALASGQVKWFVFDFGDLPYLDIATNDSTFDTEIGLYTSTGALVAANDDDGFGLWSVLTFGTGSGLELGDYYNLGGNGIAEGEDGPLGPGTYYLALGGYNTTYGLTGWEVLPGTASGDYVVTFYAIPEPASFALLALGCLALIRRR